MTYTETLEQIQLEVSHSDEKATLLAPLEPFVLEILTKEKAFIAGGAITSLFSNKPICDYDIFFRDEESYRRVDGMFRGFFQGSTTSTKNMGTLSTTHNAVTYQNFRGTTLTLQLIRIPASFKSNPIDIFNEFDFVACCGLYDFETDRFKFHRDFLKHVSQRKLVYQMTHQFPISSLLRVEKYKAKGYSIDNTNFLKIVLHISSLGITTNKQAAQHFQGMYLGEKRKAFAQLLQDDSPLDITKFIEIIEGRNQPEPSRGLSGVVPDDLPF
jgi:hypothetical protein